MAYTLIVHISDEDPVVGEVEELPAATDLMVTLTNPRRLDGKELYYLAAGVVEVIWPMHRVNFIELMPTEDDTIIGFVRE
jgi:hypothetical protein